MYGGSRGSPSQYRSRIRSEFPQNQLVTHSCDRLGILMIGFSVTFLTFLPNVAVFML